MSCSVSDCTQRVHSRGWCKKHYERWRKHGDVSVVLKRADALQPGQRFGRLTVLELTPERHHRFRRYRCLCDCGQETFADSTSLLSHRKQSCGCLLDEYHARRKANAKPKPARKRAKQRQAKPKVKRQTAQDQKLAEVKRIIARSNDDPDLVQLQRDLKADFLKRQQAA